MSDTHLQTIGDDAYTNGVAIARPGPVGAFVADRLAALAILAARAAETVRRRGAAARARPRPSVAPQSRAEAFAIGLGCDPRLARRSR